LAINNFVATASTESFKRKSTVSQQHELGFMISNC